MATKITATGRFNGSFPYIDDRGVERQLATRFNLPSHFEDADVSAIAGIMLAGGAQPFKVRQTIINDIGDNPCPESNNIKPRKFRFIFEDNSSFSVPFNKVLSPIDVVTQIITNINGATDARLVCIQLIGEEFQDILTEFENNFTNSPILPNPANRYYSGQANYQDDVLGKQLLLPFKILSENAPTAPPSAVREAWNDCVGELQTSTFSCGSASRRIEHRRFIPQFVVNDFLGGATDINGSESHEIPILNRAPQEIQNCAESIVDTLDGSIFCLSYKGHSDNRFHLNQGVDLTA